MNNANRNRWIALPAGLLFTMTCFVAPIGVNADGKGADDEKPATPSTERDGLSPDAPPSLDDLLGLDEDEADASGEAAAERSGQEDLERELSGEHLANAFEQALAEMARSADLLDVSFDAGIGTQRIQEDVLSKLQQLIDQARQQQSSSSSSSSDQQQQPDSQQSDPGRQDQQQQNQQQSQQGNGEDGEETEGPPLQQEDLDSALEETRAEWGALPQRVRDMLLQGRQERFSSLYEQMTREYYRRLAEE